MNTRQVGSTLGVGVAIGIGVERTAMAFGHERLDSVDGAMRSAKKRASIRQIGPTPIPTPTPK